MCVIQIYLHTVVIAVVAVEGNAQGSEARQRRDRFIAHLTVARWQRQRWHYGQGHNNKNNTGNSTARMRAENSALQKLCLTWPHCLPFQGTQMTLLCDTHTHRMATKKKNNTHTYSERRCVVTFFFRFYSLIPTTTNNNNAHPPNRSWRNLSDAEHIAREAGPVRSLCTASQRETLDLC